MVSLGKKKGSNLIPKLLVNNIYIEDTKQISDYFKLLLHYRCQFTTYIKTM